MRVVFDVRLASPKCHPWIRARRSVYQDKPIGAYLRSVDMTGEIIAAHEYGIDLNKTAGFYILKLIECGFGK